jgi:hypothetical protein
VTAWDSQRTTTQQRDDARSRADQLQTQLGGMLPDDPARVQLQQRFDVQHGSAAGLDQQLGHLADTLRASRREWSSLADEEQQLRDTTAERLDDIDLHSLKDPGFWGSVVEGAFELVKWVDNFTGLHDLVDALVALAHGDWANFLWRLRDFLDKALLIVGLVALFVCPALAIVLLVGASLKLAIDAGLYATGTADPKTGRPISLTDLAFDTADVVLGAIGVSRMTKTLAEGKDVLTTAQKTRHLVTDGSAFAKGDAAVRNTVLTKYGMPLVGRHSAEGAYRTGVTKFVFRSAANTFAVVNTGRSATDAMIATSSEVTDRPTVGLFDAQAHPSRSTRPIIGEIDPWKVTKTGGKILTTAWR